MQTFLEYLVNTADQTTFSVLSESIESDKHERNVANNINIKSKELGLGLKAERPKVDTTYSDVRIVDINNPKIRAWLEVKMNKTDNLSNIRLAYAHNQWRLETEVNYAGGNEFAVHTDIERRQKYPAIVVVLNQLNSDNNVKKLMTDIAIACNIEPNDLVLTSSQALKLRSLCNDGKKVTPDADELQEFFAKRGNQYICKSELSDLGELIAQNYLIGKAEPVYYIQSEDDLYRTSEENPLGFVGSKGDIPLFNGAGMINARISFRKNSPETGKPRTCDIQPELKLFKDSGEPSPYSVAPNSKKEFPIRSL